MTSQPAAATDVQFRLVFRGKLGQEDGAVAVGRANPVSGFAFVPSYLPADGIGGAMVGDGLEHQLALDLEQVADLVEDLGELGVCQEVGCRRRRIVELVGSKIGRQLVRWAVMVGRVRHAEMVAMRRRVAMRPACFVMRPAFS